jgi:hypothetical protein
MSTRRERPEEQEAVRTTIVGGRPPGSGRSNTEIPRGIEVLVKKASVDAAFRELLLEKRAGAAETIGLTLDPAESAMVNAVPREQLEAIIDSTSVPTEQRRAFLGKVAAAMLAAIGVSAVGCAPATDGIRPDRPDQEGKPAEGSDQITRGIRSDRPPDPPPATKGIQPDRPESEPAPSTGIRSDRPPEPAPPAPTGSRPDRPEIRPAPATLGIQPDRPGTDKIVTFGLRIDRP